MANPPLRGVSTAPTFWNLVEIRKCTPCIDLEQANQPFGAGRAEVAIDPNPLEFPVLQSIMGGCFGNLGWQVQS
jgi:hypothetical protein